MAAARVPTIAKKLPKAGKARKLQSPTFLLPETGFMEDSFSTEGAGGGFRMIQAHYIYFYYYYISSDHQALDPGGWETLTHSTWQLG